jgi:hypothetical protein
MLIWVLEYTPNLHIERNNELIHWVQLTEILGNALFILILLFLDTSESPATGIALRPI